VCKMNHVYRRSPNSLQPARFGHGHAGPEIQIPLYRKPQIPPRRPLSFFLAGFMILGSVIATTGLFLFSPASLPEDGHDKHPRKTWTEVQK